MKERPDVGVYVKDLSTFVVNNADDMDRIMTLGNKNSELLSALLILMHIFWSCVISRHILSIAFQPLVKSFTYCFIVTSTLVLW